MSNSLIDGKSKIAWIGHKSWIKSPQGVIFDTKKEAIEAGWFYPCRVKITVIARKS